MTAEKKDKKRQRTQQEALAEQNLWLIRLRWIAALGIVFAVFVGSYIFPYPLGNVIGGGAHKGYTSIQEFLVLPTKAETIKAKIPSTRMMSVMTSFIVLILTVK